MTILSYLADYEAYKKGRGLKEGTVLVSLAQLKRFDLWLKEKRKRDVRRVVLTDLTSWLSELIQRLAPATVYGHAI
ncbi:MAG: hypothetical protein ABIJ86_02115 [Spirochaetota bacterium]